MPTRPLVSDGLVARREREVMRAVGGYPADNQPVYTAAAEIEGANAGVDSYLRNLGRRLKLLGLQYVEIRGVTPHEYAAEIAQVRGRPGADIIMTPKHNLHEFVPTLAQDPARDGDAMTPAGAAMRWKATPRSICSMTMEGVRRLNRVAPERFAADGDLGSIDPGRLAVVGFKGDVGNGVMQLLADQNIVPGIQIDRNNSDELIPRLHKDADVVISAVGRAGLLRADDLVRTNSDGKSPLPMLVIDAGVSPQTKRNRVIRGDVDFGVFAYDGDQEILVTPAPIIFPDGTVQNAGHTVGTLTVVEFIAGGVLEVSGPGRRITA